MFQSEPEDWKKTHMQADAVRQGFSLLSLFLLRSSGNWMRPNHTMEGKMLYLIYQFKYLTHQEAPPETHPE